MKKAVVEAWLSGLRSGKYEQHRGMIHNGTKGDALFIVEPTAFCCIGVGALCNGMPLNDMQITGQAVEHIGLSSWILNDLIRMNDREKKSFAEIADWIEANILPNATD